MASQNLRPQDIVVLLKILCFGEERWMSKDLAQQLYLSTAEISHSLQRNANAGLLDIDNRSVHTQALLELLRYGIPYFFPQRAGSLARGLPTAHSHPYFKDKIVSTDIYVWPDAESNIRGFSIEPLYPGAVHAAKKDPQLYLYLSLTDVLRIGKAREKEIAIDKLQEEFYEPSH